MPAKSQAQQRLFGMAWAVRKGEMSRKDASEEVLKIADSDMTDKEIKDFAKTKGLKEHLLESIEYIPKYSYKPLNEIVPETNEKKIFIIIKPGFLDKSKEIIEMFQKEDFKLFQTRSKVLSFPEAKRIYRMHEKEDWYKSLCKYMSSGESTGLTFTYPDEWTVKGAFEKTDKLKNEIRKKWSESDMRNVMHSSDNEKNMMRESEIFL